MDFYNVGLIAWHFLFCGFFYVDVRFCVFTGLLPHSNLWYGQFQKEKVQENRTSNYISHTALQSLKSNYIRIPLKMDRHRNPEGSRRANCTPQGVGTLRRTIKIIAFLSNQIAQRRWEQAEDIISVRLLELKLIGCQHRHLRDITASAPKKLVRTVRKSYWQFCSFYCEPSWFVLP